MPDDHDLNLRGRLIRSLGALREMFPGSFVERHRKCGRPKPAAKCVPPRFTPKSRSHSDMARPDAPRCEIAGAAAGSLDKKPYILDYDKYSLS